MSRTLPKEVSEAIDRFGKASYYDEDDQEPSLAALESAILAYGDAVREGAMEPLGRALELIREVLPYALDHWDWKYGEEWRAEELEIAHAAALLLPGGDADREETR